MGSDLGETFLAAKLEAARKELQDWVDQQGHNRCWYYPDIFARLCKILDVQATKAPALPPRQEFREGCRRFESEEYDGDARSGDEAAPGLGEPGEADRDPGN